MSDLPGDYQEDPGDVMKAIDLIEYGLIPSMRYAVKSLALGYGFIFDFDPIALSMFRRRYRMAISKAIHDHPSNDHLGLLAPVMEAQARIAAAIAVFKAIKYGPVPNPGSELMIDKESLQQATHIMENECRDFMTRKAAQDSEHGEGERTLRRAIYCS